MRARRVALLIALVAGGFACRPAGADRAASRGGTVDSVRPRDAELAQFRRGLSRVDSLSGGASTREALVRDYVRALEQRDTTALRTMLMSVSEYAWLYYPTTLQALPPYDLSPELLWFTMSRRSEQDLGVALAEIAGKPLGYVGHTCADTARVEGENRIWGYCAVERRLQDGRTTRERLFGLIIERHGRYKFVNYANKLS